MNTNRFEKFHCHLLKYQILYVFLIIIIVAILFLNLIFLSHIKKVKYGAKIENNRVIIDNLEIDDVNIISKKKNIFIKDKVYDIKAIDIEEPNSKYLIKLQLDEVIEDEFLEVEFALEEESLYKFVLKTMKGEH